MEITFVLSAAIIKKVVKCSLLLSPTKYQQWWIVRIKDYHL